LCYSLYMYKSLDVYLYKVKIVNILNYTLNKSYSYLIHNQCMHLYHNNYICIAFDRLFLLNNDQKSNLYTLLHILMLENDFDKQEYIHLTNSLLLMPHQ